MAATPEEFRSAKPKDDDTVWEDSGSNPTLLPSTTFEPDMNLSQSTVEQPVQKKISNVGSTELDLLFPSLPDPSSEPKFSRGGFATFDARRLCIAGGVAIFHISTGQVVLCYHTRDKYWFLPKGRRDVNEESGTGACREGFEESGFRNRLLPLPLPHIQPEPHSQITNTTFNTEPVMTNLMPISRSRQYLLHWYIAETLPPLVEQEVTEESNRGKETGDMSYVVPPAFDKDLTLRKRMELDWKQETTKKVMEMPVRHEGTGVDSEEALYQSRLVPVATAINILPDGMDWVVRLGWMGIKQRWEMEEQPSEVTAD